MIPQGDAHRLLTKVLSIPPGSIPICPSSSGLSTLPLRLASVCTIAFMCAGRARRSELLTADDRLARTLQPTFPFIESLAPLPWIQ